MRKVWAWGGAAAIAAIAACATSTPPSGNGQNESDAGDIPLYDAGGAPPSDSGGSTTCTLGSADHCGTCTTVCPGPTDADSGTERVCSDSTTTATCDIICQGEHYDLNGDISDGCEGVDPIVHDNADAAVPETVSTTGMTVGAPYWFAYGDAREHDVAPISRPLGREDWYVITSPTSTPAACLTIAGFPADDQFEVCITNYDTKSIEPAQCKTVDLTASGACPTDSTKCCVAPASTHSASNYWVRVRKLAGANTANGYALFLEEY